MEYIPVAPTKKSRQALENFVEMIEKIANGQFSLDPIPLANAVAKDIERAGW